MKNRSIIFFPSVISSFFFSFVQIMSKIPILSKISNYVSTSIQMFNPVQNVQLCPKCPVLSKMSNYLQIAQTCRLKLSILYFILYSNPIMAKVASILSSSQAKAPAPLTADRTFNTSVLFVSTFVIEALFLIRKGKD